MCERELILVRGVSGSGKSTLAGLFGVRVYSADDYFLNSDGNYHFDYTKLKRAHFYCRDMVSLAMSKNEEKVVVANTFTQEWEMQPYLELAKLYKYRVHTIIVENRHGSMNIHSVPQTTVKLSSLPSVIVKAQKERFEVVLQNGVQN